MTQHYQRNVCGVSKWCPTCGKMTMHKVSDRRVGCCTEPHAVGMSKAQEKREKKKKKDVDDDKQLGLF